MTPQEAQAYFDENGFWPMPALIIRPRKISAREAANNLLKAARGSVQRGWKAPLHWIEPPLFQNPGAMFEELGQEEFLRQVTEYWQGVSSLHCARINKEHTRWAIRQVLRNFELHVRGFRGQSVSSRGGRIRGFSSGQEYHRASKTYSDILVMPEDLGLEDGRLVNEIEAHLRNYAVPEVEIASSAAEVRRRLESTWGIKL